MSMIDVRGLSKSYGDMEALSGLDLTVEEGEIYGFLGPNGAGKSTTIKIIMGLTKMDQGDVRVDGRDITEEGHRIRERLGYLPEKISFYGDMSVRENLEFFCDLKGCSREIIPRLKSTFQIDEDLSKKVSALSKGMVQRLGLAQTLIGDPDLLVLDEPTTGLDPEIRRWLKDKILELKEQGKTIFLSSHNLADVQALCDRVGMISAGEMIAVDSIDALGEKLDLGYRLQLTVEPLEEGLKVVKRLPFVSRPRVEDVQLVLYCGKGEKMDVIKALLEQDLEMMDFTIKEPDLEEIFVKVMGIES